MSRGLVQYRPVRREYDFSAIMDTTVYCRIAGSAIISFSREQSPCAPPRFDVGATPPFGPTMSLQHIAPCTSFPRIGRHLTRAPVHGENGENVPRAQRETSQTSRSVTVQENSINCPPLYPCRHYIDALCDARCWLQFCALILSFSSIGPYRFLMLEYTS